jgi:hypothetical protein
MVSGQLHGLASLRPEEQPLGPTAQEAQCAPQSLSECYYGKAVLCLCLIN